MPSLAALIPADAEFNPWSFVIAIFGLVVFLSIFAAVIWRIARKSEKKNFTDMLVRLSHMTMKMKEAEHLGHFGSFSWDRDPNKTFWSEEMFALFDMVPGQTPPPIEKVLSMILEEDREKASAQMRHALEVSGTFSVSFRVLGAGKIVRYLRLDGKNVLGSDKKTSSFEGIAHDITHEVEVERAKTEFVSLASHQLKTPLTAISWLTEALLSGDKGALGDEQKKYIENIHETDRRMMQMVNDLLNVSRIELGTLQLRPEEIDVDAFAKSAIDEQRKAAEDKGIRINVNFEQDLPHMKVDRNLMRMVFQNLVSNAIKYTPEKGSVTVTMSRGSGMKDTLFISVADTGMGIPKDEQDKVFSKLHRAKNAQSKVPDGTGLGLYVVKTIIERVKGVITFDSEENKGTTFYVTLPVVWQESKKE